MRERVGMDEERKEREEKEGRVRGKGWEKVGERRRKGRGKR
jgi:hypothetical protein